MTEPPPRPLERSALLPGVVPPELVRRPGRWGRLALRLWHPVLSAGAGDMARLRGWDRYLIWRSHAVAGARLRALVSFLKLPARAARDARDTVRRVGDDLQRESGVTRRRQLAQIWWLRVRYGLLPHTYLQLRLYRPERWRRAGEYLQVQDYFRVGRFLNASHRPDTHAMMLHDKLRFGEWCAERRFPVAAALMEFENGRMTYSCLAADMLPACDLFSKPSDSTGGHGACRWVYDGAGGYKGADGRARKADELTSELARMSETLPGKYGRQSHRILLQRCLSNHPGLADLTPGAVGTVRIVTYRFPRDSARLLLAVYKMPVGAMAADNFHFGGLCAPVNVADGRLGGAVGHRGPLIVDVERHPDTGARVEGHILPGWNDAVRLVLNAHDALRCVPTMGWDVALTPEGPVLVEGNSLPNPHLSQLPSGSPLGITPFVRCITAHLRESLGV